MAALCFREAASEVIPSPPGPSLASSSHDKPEGSQNFPKSCSIPERKEARLETGFAEMVVCNSDFWFGVCIAFWVVS